jgi:hypothetical protein
MGVHFSRPAKLLNAGKLSAHVVADSAWVASPTKSYAIFDGEECERDYQEYQERYDAGDHGRRPRAWLHLRAAVLRHLKAVKTPIAFDDAIGLVEAAKILRVTASMIPRLAAGGKIVARQPWSSRGRTGPRIWIVSRQSCQANIKADLALAAAGKKVGRPRKK